MIQQFSFALLFAGGFLFIVFVLVGYAVRQEKRDCEHETKTTYDSYHKQVCVDCLEEFSTKED